MSFPPVVRLLVGGEKFTVARSTLFKYPDSMLARMFRGDVEVLKDGDA